VQLPSEAVTIVFPSAVVVVLPLTEPPPECTVTPFGPLVWLVTPPGPALTLLETLPDVLRSFILRSTTLQFLLLGLDDEDVAVPSEDDAELDELLVCA